MFRYGKIPKVNFPSNDRACYDQTKHLNHLRSLIVLSTKVNNLPFCGIITGSVTNWTFMGWTRYTCSPPSKSTGKTIWAAWRTCAWVEQYPTSLYPTVDWLCPLEMWSCRCLQEVVTHLTDLHKPPYCMTISVCLWSDNDVETFCWYCLICYAHMNLKYTIFVDCFSLCEKYWASNLCIVSFVD